MGRRVSCQFCGRELTVRNMARHLRQSCRVWDPGGARPRPAVSGQRKDLRYKSTTPYYPQTKSQKS